MMTIQMPHAVWPFDPICSPFDGPLLPKGLPQTIDPSERSTDTTALNSVPMRPEKSYKITKSRFWSLPLKCASQDVKICCAELGIFIKNVVTLEK
jgi:hypothetical protein